MSGHSKWATIKHKKGAADKARAKVFNKIARQLEVAAREGGGDPSTNASLRTVILKAKGAQMTNDAIDRAVKRGAGVSDGGTYEAIMYEGYAPGGVAMLVDVLTDNRNRTGAEIRNLFTKNGGSMAEPGAVAWQFERKGIVMANREAAEDDLMLLALDAGAEDITDDGDAWRITTGASELHAVRTALEDGGVAVSSSELTMLPTATISLDTSEAAKKVLRLIDILDDNDDVQDVYANFDIPDEILEGIDA